MRIKGSALLARREIVTRRFGAAAWSEFVADMAQSYAYFRQPLFASSLIPVDDFLRFHDGLMLRFFEGGDDAYFQLGRESATWALTTGPYKRFLDGKDLGAFVDALPHLSSTYWEASTTTYSATLEGDVVDFRVKGLPRWHAYFEYLVVGYIGAALELLRGKPVDMKQVKGGSGTAFHYQFRVPSIVRAR